MLKAARRVVTANPVEINFDRAATMVLRAAGRQQRHGNPRLSGTVGES